MFGFQLVYGVRDLAGFSSNRGFAKQMYVRSDDVVGSSKKSDTVSRERNRT